MSGDAALKQEAPSLFRPSEWRPLTGLEPGRPRATATFWTLAFELGMLFMLPFAGKADVFFLALLPVGAAAWAFGRTAGVSVALANILGFAGVERLAFGWGPMRLLSELGPWSASILVTGAAVGQLAALADKQRRSEQKARRDAQLLDRTLEAAETAIAYYDSDGKLLHANRASLRAHGVALDAARGKTHAEAFGCAAHDEMLARVIRTRTPYTELDVQLPCMRGAGEDRYWDLRVDPILIDHDRGVIMEARDVTEQHAARAAREQAEAAVRESESRLRLIAEHVDDVIFLVTPDLSQVVYVNPAYEKLTGRPAAQLEREPLSWFENLLAEDQEKVARAITEEVLQGKRATIQIRLVPPDGRPGGWARIVAVPLMDDGGKVFRIAGVAHDITRDVDAIEAARRDEANRLEIAHLKEVTAFKTQFLNTAAHELATPITPLQFELRALRAGYGGAVTAEQAESLDSLARNVDRLTVLVNDLLDAARLESGRLRLREEDVDLAELVRQTAKPFAGVAEEAGVALIVHADAPVPVHVDPARIGQVLTNLIDNAIRYTPKGGEVHVRADTEGGEARATVHDTGRGLTTEQIARLFQPFSQVQPEGPYHGRQGSGLGLFISKGIVESHHGRIGCESEGAGRGSTFLVALPLRPQRDEPLVVTPPQATLRTRPDATASQPNVA
jgi:PAS domain S-box-containing protein